MAEVVEINLICKDEVSPDILREFVHKETENRYGYEVIEAMDNWEYENSIEIHLEDIRNYLLRNKIICIEEKIEDGAVGTNIERLENGICYTVWFNQKNMII